MGSKFCVKFQRCHLKFHTKVWTHTPQNVPFTIFIFSVWVTISLDCDVISLSETVPWTVKSHDLKHSEPCSFMTRRQVWGQNIKCHLYVHTQLHLILNYKSSRGYGHIHTVASCDMMIKRIINLWMRAWLTYIYTYCILDKSIWICLSLPFK